MAIWNESYNYEKDTYSDGDIEEVLLSIVKENADYDEEAYSSHFTLAYHLSPIRENILNWYPFQKNESVLEIGAGCGAITGLFCERLGEVVSVDLSKRRSQINYERHKQYDNLTIMVGNFNDIKFDHQFDYVVLNGVLEYAMSFTHTEHPYEDFLHAISSFLKEDGKLLIAIENKLGLKYFNGSKEDHVGDYFAGLNGYQDNDWVRTFTKKELVELLNSVGYSYTQFYYPYPDYKFPNEIFTDDSLERNQYGRPYTNLEENRVELFDESSVGDMLLKEEIRDRFANSFLLIASKKEIEKSVFYVKLDIERKQEFRIGTMIYQGNGEKRVRKFPLDIKSRNHIANTLTNSKRVISEKVYNLGGEPAGEAIEFSYLKQKSLFELIIDTEHRNRESIVNLVRDFWEELLQGFEVTETDDFYSEQFLQWFGETKTDKMFHCIKGTNVDYITDNIFPVEQKYQVIDTEWFYEELIPCEFLKWRSLSDLYIKAPDLEQIVKKEELFQIVGVASEDEVTFREWEKHFTLTYVGIDTQYQLYQPKIPVKLGDVIRQKDMMKEAITMSLYIDYGEGMSEETKLVQLVKLEEDGSFQVEFQIPDWDRAKQYRFDPIEGHMCACMIKDIPVGVDLIGKNCDSSDESQGDIFCNTDPQYYFKSEESKEALTILGNLRIYGEEALIIHSKNLYEQIRKNEMEKQEMLERQKRFEQEMLEKQKNLEQELLIKQTNLEERIREESAKTTEMQKQIGNQDQMISQLMERLKKIDHRVGALEYDHQKLKSLWPFRVYRFIKNRLRKK